LAAVVHPLVERQGVGGRECNDPLASGVPRHAAYSLALAVFNGVEGVEFFEGVF
jgi:hypothetical protein